VLSRNRHRRAAQAELMEWIKRRIALARSEGTA